MQRSRADSETKTADSETNRHADSETNGHADSETQLRKLKHPDSETNVRKPKLTFGNLNLHDQSHLMHQVIKQHDMLINKQSSTQRSLGHTVSMPFHNVISEVSWISSDPCGHSKSM